MTIPRYKLIALLQSYGCKPFGQYLDHEIWVSPPPANTVIRIPAGLRIHFDLVEIICLELLNMSMWEFDYWLGQSGIE